MNAPSMIDLHSHILPGVDDGPVTLQESLEMLALAQHNGTARIAATPHFWGMMDKQKCAELTDTFQLLKNAALDAGLTIEIRFALEIFITTEFEAYLDFPCCSYDGKNKHLLFEFAMTDLPVGYHHILRDIAAQGITPIVAHPERNLQVISKPEHALKMVDAGARLQLTAASVTGRFGKTFYKSAHKLLKKDLVFAVASDGHDACLRVPVLNEAFTLVSKKYGKNKAEQLFIENPAEVIS